VPRHTKVPGVPPSVTIIQFPDLTKLPVKIVRGAANNKRLGKAGLGDNIT